MKKKSLALVLLITMLGVTACGEGNSAAGQSSSVSESIPTENREIITESSEVAPQKEVSMEELEQHAETSAEDFTYSVLEDHAYISGYHGTDNLVVIPGTIEGLPVTIVGGLSNSGIAGIKFADNVEKIGENCFFGDESIQYVICGEGLREIENQGFSICENMKEIRLNVGIETVGDRALCTRSSQMTDLYIPDSITKIGVAAFDMEGTVLLHVKAGSIVEQYCVDRKVPGSFPNLTYIVE